MRLADEFAVHHLRLRPMFATEKTVMENERQEIAQLAALADALNALRDTWQLLCMILQDKLVEELFAERDAALSEVEQ